VCFSAAGSFAVSGVLAGLGAVSLAKSPSVRHRVFAAIPLLFAVQQAAEGVVWSTLSGGAGAALHGAAVLVFLGFALVVWPTWMPLSLALVERDPARRRVLAGFAVAGVLFSLFGAVLLAAGPLTSRIVGHCIRYEFGASHPIVASDAFFGGYLAVTIAPFFVSRTSLARPLGAVLLVSLALAILVQRAALTSVWCFFAAIVSGLVLVSVLRESR
jgi:hypothetical protein